MYLENKYKGWLSSLIKLENSGLEDVVFYGHTEKICGYSEIAFLQEPKNWENMKQIVKPEMYEVVW